MKDELNPTARKIAGNSSNRRLKVYLWFFFGFLFIAFIGYLTVLAYLAPIQKTHLINDKYHPKPANSQFADYRIDPVLYEFKKQEAFLKSRLAMVKSDSLCLTVDMVDSMLILEIQGVAVQKTKMINIRKSGIFKSIDSRAFINQFSSPFRVDSMVATIPKEPYTIKQAPADTIQAASQNDPKPDTVQREPVHLLAFLDKDIVLEICQSEEEIEGDFPDYALRRKIQRAKRFLKSAAEFKVPIYEPWILIEVPAREAKAIYRALPEHGLITIRLD